MRAPIPWCSRQAFRKVEWRWLHLLAISWRWTIQWSVTLVGGWPVPAFKAFGLCSRSQHAHGRAQLPRKGFAPQHAAVGMVPLPWLVAQDTLRGSLGPLMPCFTIAFVVANLLMLPSAESRPWGRIHM